MFCRELFGKKPTKLDFGLQPHKIPDCDVVRIEKCHNCVSLYDINTISFTIHMGKTLDMLSI